MPSAVTASAIGEEEKAQVRAVVFGHLAGVVVAPTVKALWDRRVFDLFGSAGDWVDFDQHRSRDSCQSRLLASRVALAGILRMVATASRKRTLSVLRDHCRGKSRGARSAASVRRSALFCREGGFPGGFFVRGIRPARAPIAAGTCSPVERTMESATPRRSRHRQSAKSNSPTSRRHDHRPVHGCLSAGRDSGSTRATGGALMPLPQIARASTASSICWLRRNGSNWDRAHATTPATRILQA